MAICFLTARRLKNTSPSCSTITERGFGFTNFRCGIGLVSLSFFSHLAGAEGSLTNHTRSVMHRGEYQWFTHDLPAEFFGGCVDETTIKRLGDYFIEKLNPALVYPYSI